MLNQITHPFNHGQGRSAEGAVFIYAQPIAVVYCFPGKNELVNIRPRRRGGVGDQAQLVAFQALGVAHVGVIDVHPVDDDTAVDIRLVKNRPGKTRFAAGNVRHRIIQVGGEGNARTEADFRLFQRSVGVARGDNDPGGDQFADHFWLNALRGEGHFGDHIGVVAQEIDQRRVRFTHVVRIVGAFLNDIQPRPFEMQAQRLVRMFLQIFAHHAHALLHQIVAGGNQRRQEAGAA